MRKTLAILFAALCCITANAQEINAVFTRPSDGNQNHYQLSSNPNVVLGNDNTITFKLGDTQQGQPYTLTGSNTFTVLFGSAINENKNVETLEMSYPIAITSGGKLTVSGTMSNTNAQNLVIENGGQLIHSNASVAATLQKDVITYTVENGRTGWNMVAAPFTGTASATFGDNFDLYTYNEPTHYWIYNATPNLTLGAGYLFAKPTTNDTDFELSGTLQASNEDMSFPLSYTGTLDVLKGFNLVGNPFPCNAYVNMDYMVLNAEGSGFIDGSVIKPGDAILVQANDANQQITFSRNEPAQQNNCIDVSVSQNRGNVIDNARIRFGEGHTMNKFYLNENSTRLYIPQNGEDFAVIMASAAEGEMPLNFKAAKNGTYTITVNTENVEANYLHLIDNMTGMDTDLLSTPTYTFDANTSDYASRFKLIFGVKDDTETIDNTFAFISNGEIIISNEGRATLQVIDAMGRIIRNQQIEGEARISTEGLTAGVYVLSLNGMTQKIVVR